MADYIIVGAGISGIIAARILKSLNKDFIVLEREDHVGGRGETGHHRILQDKSIDYLKRWSPIDWLRVDENPRERKKGEWIPTEPVEEEQEQFYLRPSFYQPKSPFTDVIKTLSEPVIDRFEFRKTVDRIDSEKRVISCQDGSEYPYKTLIWCTHLGLLRKLWSGNDLELSKSLKKTVATFSGVNIDFTVGSPLFEFQNSVVFPFRFKDLKLKAIGVQDAFTSSGDAEERNLHWILFLEEEITEDREEVAKIIRTFKRELGKEFPEFGKKVKHEKITFLPRLSGEPPIDLKSLEISPGVIYLGPQAKLKDESEDEVKSINLDRAIQNCRVFETEIAQKL